MVVNNNLIMQWTYLSQELTWDTYAEITFPVAFTALLSYSAGCGYRTPGSTYPPYVDLLYRVDDFTGAGIHFAWMSGNGSVCLIPCFLLFIGY